jgi:hypothetical protein
MLAPRIQTSDFYWPNIELGERGALFLSNYMKLQQLSHSFWQRLYRIAIFSTLIAPGYEADELLNAHHYSLLALT